MTLLRGVVAATLFAGLAVGAKAAPVNLVTNGDFEETSTNLTAGETGFQPGFNGTLTGWSSTGPAGSAAYNFVFSSGGADTVGANGIAGNLALHGPNNGSSNGLPASSPSGGNFVAADGAFETGPLTQTINGLTPGQSYNLSFYYAGAQQSTYTGATTEGWQVSLGGETQSTPVLSNPSQGFTGWQSEVMTFTATAASETLSFLAVGSPVGVPPFALLDGVQLQGQTVPEPASLLVLGVGLVGLTGAVRYARRSRMV